MDGSSNNGVRLNISSNVHLGVFEAISHCAVGDESRCYFVVIAKHAVIIEVQRICREHASAKAQRRSGKHGKRLLSDG